MNKKSLDHTMSVVGEEKALPPECKAGCEVLQGGGDWKPIENLEIENIL